MNIAETMQITTPSEREILMTRVFDAPRHLVFKAYTTPELLKRWLGVRNGWTLDVCEVDLQVGGRYRYVWRGPNGQEMGMGGTFLEIESPERLVSTEAFDNPWYPGEAVGTVRFVEQGGQTTLNLSVLYQTQEVRDTILRSGMADGVGESFDKLAEVLETMGA